MQFKNIQPSFDSNRQVLGKILPLDTPFTVIIDSSEACNFQCSYCFRADPNKENWGYAKHQELMQWGTFLKIVEQLKAFPQPIKQISLSHHGEPLCHKRLPEMVKYIKSQGITARISIHTNASLLKGTMLDELAECGIDRVVVSLQGLSSDKYKQVCGFTLNYGELVDSIATFYKKKKKNTQLCVKIADVALLPEEHEIFYKTFSDKCDRMYVEKIVPIWMNRAQIGQKPVAENKFGFKFEPQTCCPLIFHTIVVSPNGDVYPCTQLLTPHVLGNIHTSSLLELWNSEKRTALLKEQCHPQQPALCQNCYILQNCIFSKEDMIDSYREEIYNRL